MRNKNTGDRDLTYDIVRSFCILEIVGFWHLQDYREPMLVTDSINTYGGIVTQGVLGAFTLMSSVFLSKYKIVSLGDYKDFYYKRLKRFFFPFFLPSLSLYIASSIVGECWYSSFGNFLLSIAGLTAFFLPQPATLWYMSMLIFFYSITPIILFFNQLGRVLSGIMLFVMVLIIGNCWAIDTRIFTYMPVYLFGLVMPLNIMDKMKNNGYILFFSIIITFLDVFVFTTNIFGFPNRHYLLTISTPILLISAFSFFSKNKKVSWIASKISFASMNMYLFHRQWFLLFVFLFGYNSTSMRDSYLSDWILVFIVLPIIWAFSYGFQILYNELIDVVLKKNARKIKL